MADFKIGDKVKLVRMPDEYNGKTGVIIKDGSKQGIPTFSRKLGEGFKTEEGQQQWIVMLDDTNEPIVVPDINLEKIP